MCKLLDSHQALTLVTSRKCPVHWFCYSNAARVLLLATGSWARKIQCYQIAANDLVKLPSFKLPCSAGVTLRADDVSLVLLYGKVYCCHVERGARGLVLYRLYRDAVVALWRYQLYFDNMVVSGVDSVLLVHHLVEAVTVLFTNFRGLTCPWPPRWRWGLAQTAPLPSLTTPRCLRVEEMRRCGTSCPLT